MSAPPTLAVVAGSAVVLDSLLDHIDWEKPFQEFPDLSSSSIAGHAGYYIAGPCGPHRVILQAGRLHFYEGFAYSEVVRTVDTLYRLGARAVLFTNAAGGLRPEMCVGDLVAVDRVLLWPFRKWPSPTEALTPELLLPGCAFRGAYHWVPGPNYETRAEIAGLQALGAAAVGMSTAPELLRARELGMRATVVSYITNNCCTAHVLTHDRVLEAARYASTALVRLIRAAMDSLLAA